MTSIKMSQFRTIDRRGVYIRRAIEPVAVWSSPELKSSKQPLRNSKWTEPPYVGMTEFRASSTEYRPGLGGS